MSTQVDVSLKIPVNVRWDEQAKVFVSNCPALKLYSQGKDEDEARNAIADAIKLYLEFPRDKRSEYLVTS